MSDKKSSYTFLHLTVQEHFAALYLSQNMSAFGTYLQNKQLWIDEDEDEYLYDKFTSDMDDAHSEQSLESELNVLLFVAGLRRLTDDFMKKILQCELNFLSKIVFPPHCRVFFECQCPHFVSEILQDGYYTLPYTYSWNDLEYFVCGYSIAHSHPSALWHLKIFSDRQAEMIKMGMHYVNSANGMGGTIESIETSIANSKLFKFHPHTRSLKELQIALEPSIRPQSGFFEGMPKYFPVLQYLSLICNDSPEDYSSLIAILPKLVNLTKLMIGFTYVDEGLEKWQPFDRPKQ